MQKKQKPQTGHHGASARLLFWNELKLQAWMVHTDGFLQSASWKNEAGLGSLRLGPARVSISRKPSIIEKKGFFTSSANP